MKVRFEEKSHQYFTDEDRELVSVTTLLHRQGLAPDYSGVKQDVLQKAKERGIAIHDALEGLFIKYASGDVPESWDRASGDVLRWLQGREVKHLDIEGIVHNDVVAGMFDIMAVVDGRRVVFDIKTTSSKDVDYWSWQSSLYAYLADPLQYEDTELREIWVTKDGAMFIGVPRKPIAEVERLIQCARDGSFYLREMDARFKNELATLDGKVLAILKAQADIKAMEADIADAKAKLLHEMEERGLKSLESDRLRVTYVAPSTRTTFDKKAFIKDNPSYDGRYDKETKVKASLRFTEKEEQE